MVHSLALVFFVVPTITGAMPVRHKAQFEEMSECRRQTVSVRFASGAAADRAVVRPLPLFGGAVWAITSRWDDNHLADHRVGESGTLERGENELLLVYRPPIEQRYSPEHAGAAFRIVDAATRSRVDDIAYRPLPVGPSPHR
jgi:hypothetical protein